MNRKQRRAMQKLANKNGAEKMQQKMMQFDKLPDECSACTKEYDKKDKQMAMTWSVVVREKENIVRLYCPECWDLANNAIKTLKKEIENVGE
tara:strand:- start:275 stop:550 length:276 start_codon:yes stop_codon:yes gene_type:complete